jgi:hypothetical protein
MARCRRPGERKVITFSLAPRRLCHRLLACLGLLVAGHAGALYAEHVFGFTYLFGLIALFDLNGEQNLPTLFSSALLLACSLALAATGRLAQRMRPGWYALAAALALMAISETAALHEPLLFVLNGNVSPRTAELAAQLPLRFADGWPVLALAGAAIALASGPFLLHLDRRTRGLFMLAGVLYAGGAVVLDGFTAAGADWPRVAGWLALASTTFEEVLEIAGAIVLLYAVLDRLARLHPGIAFLLAAAAPDAPGPADPPHGR